MGKLIVNSYVPIVNKENETEYVLLDSLPLAEREKISHILGERFFKAVIKNLNNNLDYARILCERGVIRNAEEEENTCSNIHS